MKHIKVAIAAGCVAALGAIAATVWVGVSVREDTVVAHPYEDGLLQDAERHAREALGLSVSLPYDLQAAAGPLAFELRDRAGHAVDGGAVTVEISRPDTSRGKHSARARSLGGGRWSAELAFPAPGPWDVRFDVVHANHRVRMERRVTVRPACDLDAGPCTTRLGEGGEVTLDVGPRPIRAMQELAIRVQVREATSTSTAASTTTPTPTVTVSFSMPGMTMGENRSRLISTGPATYEGKAVLVGCGSGRRDWAADVELAAPGAAPRTARFHLTLAEESR